MNISKLADGMVKPLCEKFRDQLQKALAREKELKKQIDALESISQNVDVATLIKGSIYFLLQERDEYK